MGRVKAKNPDGTPNKFNLDVKRRFAEARVTRRSVAKILGITDWQMFDLLNNGEIDMPLKRCIFALIDQIAAENGQ